MTSHDPANLAKYKQNNSESRRKCFYESNYDLVISDMKHVESCSGKMAV